MMTMMMDMMDDEEQDGDGDGGNDDDCGPPLSYLDFHGVPYGKGGDTLLLIHGHRLVQLSLPE